MPELVGLAAQRKPVIGGHYLSIGANGAQDDKMRASALRADFGDFRRAEPARKRKLKLVCHLLVTKHQNGMFFEGCSYRGKDSLVRGDICKRHATKLGGKSRTQRLNVHGFSPSFYCMKLEQIWVRGNDPAEVRAFEIVLPGRCFPSQPDRSGRTSRRSAWRRLDPPEW